ncbi:MAG: hypothetical protein ACF8R7_13840 [Phycisphaerales bacterium JB039]
MRLLLDDTPVDLDRPTLACALETGIELASAAGRVIIEVKLNGEPVGGDELATPSEEHMPGAEVALRTAEPVALVRTTLMEASDALGDAVALQRRAAAEIHAGRNQVAFDAMTAALEIWQTIQQVIGQTTDLMSIAPDDLTLELPGPEGGRISMGSRITELGAALLEARDAMRDGDLTRLADALEYDLVEKAELWQGLLAAFADALRDGAEG